MRIVHAGLIVSDLERAALYYENILGLKRVARPDLGFDGLWYGLEEGQQIHLMQLENPYAGCERPAHGGRDNHIALQSEEFDQVRQRLDAAKIPFTLSRSGRQALFCRDPDGNTIEITA
ncbi:glyoxylase I family protein [Mariprofundus aestuarium]|uniref:Glyoxylase I family protein n=1 Tax=Mariprofundus aestuarium TaxID=1921086 RepID=A0A2K8L0H7_MARES|nr:VOC family protein [Mariprofundus aestuarium]ATX80788.1 glyoxylase I family protein [Mariprofundus aestuarium]